MTNALRENGGRRERLIVLINGAARGLKFMLARRRAVQSKSTNQAHHQTKVNYPDVKFDRQQFNFLEGVRTLRRIFKARETALFRARSREVAIIR